MEVTVQRRLGIALLIVVVLLSVTASGAVIGYSLGLPPGAILPGVYVAGVHVGNLTPDQALRYIRGHVGALIDRPIEVQAAGERWSFIPAELGIAPDIESMVERAYAVGRTSSSLSRVIERFRVSRVGITIPLDVAIDQALLDPWLGRLEAAVERPAQDARLIARRDGAVEITPSQDGYQLSRTGIEERLKLAALSPDRRSVRLTLTQVAPKFSTADAQGLGVRRMVAAFTTEFDPSDFNRTENIRIAAEALDGVLLAPGQTFSFNRQVGPRVESLGYKEAPVIIDGELVPDIGGGVCQVSTTLYNAVLLAGLEVTTRIPHSIPASYVPLGRDATVAYDYIDFKFRNNTGRHVLIKAWKDHTRVTIAFFGASTPYPNARLESEIVSIQRPEVEESKTAGLAPGERSVLREGREGYHVRVWRISKTERGEERQLVSTSVYKPRNRVILVGDASPKSF